MAGEQRSRSLCYRAKEKGTVFAGAYVTFGEGTLRRTDDLSR